MPTPSGSGAAHSSTWTGSPARTAPNVTAVATSITTREFRLMLNSVQTSQTPVPTRIPTRAHTHACGDGHLGLYGRLQREQPMARRVLLGPREAVPKPRGTPVTSRLHHGSSPLSPQGEAIANPRSQEMWLCPWGPFTAPTLCLPRPAPHMGRTVPLAVPVPPNRTVPYSSRDETGFAPVWLLCRVLRRFE